MKPIARRWQQLHDWFFGGTSDRWLVALRIGLGLQLVLYCITSHADWFQMFTLHPGSFVTRDLTEALVTLGAALVPRVSWFISAGEFIGLSEATVLVGCLERSPGCGPLSGRRYILSDAAIAAWFLHLSAIKSSALLSYGVDNFTSIGLFYLMLSPLPDHLALDSRWRKWPPKNAQLQSFWQRVLQLHLCVIYFFSGLTKLLGSGWWNGESLWRALTRPPFDMVPSETLIHGRYLFIPLGSGNMSVGDQLSDFHLAAAHAANLARRHHRHAWRDCCVDGSLSFRLNHGRS